jgi:hypothetical protein
MDHHWTGSIEEFNSLIYSIRYTAIKEMEVSGQRGGVLILKGRAYNGKNISIVEGIITSLGENSKKKAPKKNRKAFTARHILRA